LTPTDLLFEPENAAHQSEMMTRLGHYFSNVEALKMVTSGNASLFRLSGERNPYRDRQRWNSCQEHAVTLPRCTDEPSPGYHYPGSSGGACLERLTSGFLVELPGIEPAA
jgi:hypothetical protein